MAESFEQCRAPEQFEFKGNNLPANWKLWKQKYHIYILASGKSTKPDSIKIAVLLNYLGDEGIRIYNTFEYEEGEDKNKLSVVLEKFDQYCEPLKNQVFEHYKFFKRNQLQGETIEQFVMSLKELANSCDFKKKDVLIRDRIVLGVIDERIQEKLLQKPDLSLAEAINISGQWNQVF
ncbi:uncharacterized protein LOC126882554 [Diabrotica virgifera virgifera]|uniref:Uncharacterized protein n=1 Tax=Diabrotica virgifera virgifera TaxID=50390 RepID=A0ABM5JZW3_DIAVI|nr:uncharacterized protein LOC126882554 [Diabrotica virgifera virgifera]